MSEPNLTCRYISQALADNGAIELRHQDGDSWTSGWFDNAEALLAAAASRHRTGNLFVSLNRPAPRPVMNRMGAEPLGNDDVQWQTRLFFDFDPVRPKGTASTQIELEHAQQTARNVRTALCRIGWPEPLEAISGNGAHLLYRCHLPNTTETRDVLTALYAGLQRDFATELVEVDRAVRNPGRIGPLYGSIKRKGPDTPDRPHRQSRITTWPREWRQVPRRAIEGLAGYYDRQQRPQQSPQAHGTTTAQIDGSGDYSTLDAVAWFTAHGLYRRPLGSYKSSERHAVRCPWEGEHSNASHDLDTSTVLFTNGTGWPGFHCSHDHCNCRTIRDVMQVLGDADRFCSREWCRV